ncbi:hypothetical protein [Halosimplex salinum]|uniref:hypothetical protein n=1 Tax=Halosimplex salinum TaxID=1710538 RepID=UPI000F47F37A|nr:hypothetical protein [Halosimplex salinum]
MSGSTPHRRFGRALAEAVDVVERLAFWAAVALPCVHLPLLVLGGFSPETTPLLLALWSLHGVSLLVGRRHRTDAPGDTDALDRSEASERHDRPDTAD